jgi:hypothetical protein
LFGYYFINNQGSQGVIFMIDITEIKDENMILKRVIILLINE